MSVIKEIFFPPISRSTTVMEPGKKCATGKIAVGKETRPTRRVADGRYRRDLGEEGSTGSGGGRGWVKEMVMVGGEEGVLGKTERRTLGWTKRQDAKPQSMRARRRDFPERRSQNKKKRVNFFLEK